MRTLALWTGVALLALGSNLAAAAVLESPKIEDLNLQRIDVIRFAPGGVLLVADGKGGQIAAIETGDTKPVSGPGAKITNVIAEIAGRLGAQAKDVSLLDLAVNPESGVAYLAIRKHEPGRDLDLIVTIDPASQIQPYSLKQVRHVKISLPKDQSGGTVNITDLAWAGDRLVAAARASEEFASKLLVVPGPLQPSSSANLYSAETYHVSHRRWETKAPMSSILPYEENGKWYIVGAFSCTPIVKYPLENLVPGAKVKGASMIELGSGNRPLNMFAYEKNGQSSVLVNTQRFHHDRAPVGPDPFWTCRFNRELLADQQRVNETAVTRNFKNPQDPAISVADAYHGVMHMDRLDNARALVVRSTGPEKRLDLEPVALP